MKKAYVFGIACLLSIGAFAGNGHHKKVSKNCTKPCTTEQCAMQCGPNCHKTDCTMK